MVTHRRDMVFFSVIVRNVDKVIPDVHWLIWILSPPPASVLPGFLPPLSCEHVFTYYHNRFHGLHFPTSIWRHQDFCVSCSYKPVAGERPTKPISQVHKWNWARTFHVQDQMLKTWFVFHLTGNEKVHMCIWFAPITNHTSWWANPFSRWLILLSFCTWAKINCVWQLSSTDLVFVICMWWIRMDLSGIMVHQWDELQTIDK